MISKEKVKPCSSASERKSSGHEIVSFRSILPSIFLGKQTVDSFVLTHLSAFRSLVLLGQHTSSERRSGSVLDSIILCLIRDWRGSITTLADVGR